MYVAQRYPEWQTTVLKKLRLLYDEEKNALPPNDKILGHLKTEESLKKVFKKVMPFVQHIKVSNIRVKELKELYYHAESTARRKG